MKKLKLYSLILVVLFQTRAFSLPRAFDCIPDSFYAGGFDFYQVRPTSGPLGEVFYRGIHFFQDTTPHGIKKGKPVQLSDKNLTFETTEKTIFFHSFNKAYEATQYPLEIPKNWNKGRITVRNKLFYNDLTADGVCYPIE